MSTRLQIADCRLRIARHVRSSASARQGEQPPEGGTPNGDGLSRRSTATAVVTRPTIKIRNPQSAIRNCAAFTLIEVLVVVVLMSFIIIALMAVFNSTQTAFRASLTQSDVLEGGRSAMGMIKSDLEAMTPSFGQSNQPLVGGWSTVPVNFCVSNNVWQNQYSSAPLLQSLVGSSAGQLRTNVLEYFFILTRQNTTWTGVGYVVDNFSTNYFYPLYRFSMSTNVMAADPTMLFNIFFTNLPSYTGLPIAPNNPLMSHLLDGVVDLRVRAYDPNGLWMTNGYPFGYTNIAKNAWFSAPQANELNEVGFYMFSNTLPASVEINLGVLEDRVIQRAQSLPNVAPALAQANYLARQAGQVHVFRQRVWIRNVDPSAYQ